MSSIAECHSSHRHSSAKIYSQWTYTNYFVPLFLSFLSVHFVLDYPLIKNIIWMRLGFPFAWLRWANTVTNHMKQNLIQKCQRQNNATLALLVFVTLRTVSFSCFKTMFLKSAESKWLFLWMQTFKILV